MTQINLTNIQFSSGNSSNKLLKEGTGQVTVPNLPAAGDVHATATIAHNFGNDNLLFQVATTSSDQTNIVLPWESNDGRAIHFASIDANNLYITVNHNDSSGFGYPGNVVTYYYRILIP